MTMKHILKATPIPASAFRATGCGGGRLERTQMKGMQRLLVILLVASAAGCASQAGRSPSASASGTGSTAESADWTVTGTPAPNSKFARLRPGMSHADVESLIGPPDNVTSHQTGKSWIPFYFGKDAFRLETYYKGEGKLTFSGSVYGNMQGKLIGVTVNPAEQGIPPR
ncbi:MAG: hypothetical protein ACREVL_13515 [Solimonas sp.]